MKSLRKILMSDPLVSSIEVQTSTVPFVDLVHFDPDIIVDPGLSNRGRYFSFVRFPVAQKLSLAKRFLPNEWRFLIKEGYRPLQIQELAFERSLQQIKGNIPNDLDFIIVEASKYEAPSNVAPHPTGGAIDLTLIDSNGNELDMGTAFDATPTEKNNAMFFDATNISDDAKRNRDILAYALESVGFVNYFPEWWHWSYGDKYWAVMTNNEKALYHPVTEQELEKLLNRDNKRKPSRIMY